MKHTGVNTLVIFMQEPERWTGGTPWTLMHSLKPINIKVSIVLYRFEQQQNNPERLFYHPKRCDEC